MKKLAFIFLMIVCSAVLAVSNKAPALKINGVSGNVLTNIEQRLAELQKIKPLNTLSKDELQSHIIKAIQPYGYFKAAVGISELNAQNITINVRVGPQVRISSIYTELKGEGKDNPLLLKTLREIPIKTGDPLLTESYNQAKQSLINNAENLGYLHATFEKSEILINEQANSARITLIFNTGYLYYFGQVQFNPTNISPELLHRYVPFHPGQPYSTELILKLNDNLSNSGYFSSVLVKPQVNDSQTVPVNLYLEPVPKYSYSIGGGYGTDTGPRGRAALHVIPVNRKGHKFNALAQGSFNQNALQAQYVIPGKNPVNDQYSITGNFSNLNYNTGYSNAFLLSLGQLHNREHFQRTLSVNALYESFHYTLQPTTDQFLLYPKATFTFIKTQSLLFSPSGYNVTFNTLGASKSLLSSIDFGQLSVDAKAAYWIEPLRLRLYGHAIQGLTATSNINQLPLSLAMLLGGTDNLKAFSFNSIGPGRILSYGGIELQKETKKNWYIVGFYDVGSVYNPTPKETLYDIGAGLMWVSPIGPIKIGFAQAINSNLQREKSSPRLVINMGPDL